MVHRIHRRRLLQGLGLSGLCLPALPSLFSRPAKANTNGFPKRFIALFSSNGSRMNKFYPDESVVGELPWVQRGPNIREVPLSQVQGDSISNVFGPELDPFRDKINLIRGLDLINQNGDHYPNFMLSGFAGDGSGSTALSESIDQVMASSSAVYGSPPHRRSLHLQIAGPQSSNTPISTQLVGGQPQGVPNELDPTVAYESIFGPLPPPDDPGFDLTAQRRASVVDSLQADYLALRDNQRIGAEDRQRLDAHVTLLDDLSSRLSATKAEGCVFPDRPVQLDQNVEANLPQITQDHMDLVVAAIKCDLTRVVNLQLCSGTDVRTFSFLGDDIAEDHHYISHDYSYGDDDLSAHKMGLIGNWYAAQVAYLLEKLDVVEDPVSGATYLDNSIVYWGNEFGTNGWHGAIGMPVMLAGGGGGSLRTGLYLDYREVGQPVLYPYEGQPTEYPSDTEFRGRCYNELLITLMQSMGLQPQDYERGGEPGFGDYSGNYLGQYDLGDRRSPLPFLTNA